MKAKTWAFVMLALMVWVGAAQAATVDVKWGTVYSYTDSGSNNRNVAEFNLKFTEDFTTHGYCVAPTITAHWGDNSYNFLDWTDSYLKAAWIMHEYAKAPQTGKDNIIHIQSSIWAAIFGDSYVPLNDALASTVNSWLSSIPTIDAVTANYLKSNYAILNTWISNRTTQTLIIAYPSQVPVPAAVWMLGSGLLAVVVMRRKRQA